MGPLNMPNIDVHLESIPKVNYDAFNTMIPWGGICIHGSFLFSSYYNYEKLTKEILVDGWVPHK
jgi:long-chain acyl-CoA synthetase